MTDYELLQLAAKAADLCVLPVHGHDDGKLYDRDYNEWNPLTDDGDAFNLMVKLRLSVEVYGDRAIAKTYFGLDKELKFAMAEERPIEDAFASVRRAITRTAAEIWKHRK